MEPSGLDPYVGTYEFYRGNDGYIYAFVPNGSSGVQIDHILMPGDAVPHLEIPDVQYTLQNQGHAVLATYWPEPTPFASVSIQTQQLQENSSQLAPDIRLTTIPNKVDPSTNNLGYAAVISDDRPITRIINPSDRYLEPITVRIDSSNPRLPPSELRVDSVETYAFQSPVDEKSPVSTDTHVEPAEDSEHEQTEEQLPLIKLAFGAWKCGICSKQLRRKHRAVVHFLNKHGDMRLGCQGRCGVVGCNKTFASQDGLDVHLNPVTVECSSCGKSLLKKNILRHQTRHCHPEDTNVSNREIATAGPSSSSTSPSL